MFNFVHTKTYQIITFNMIKIVFKNVLNLNKNKNKLVSFWITLLDVDFTQTPLKHTIEIWLEFNQFIIYYRPKN